MPINQLGYVVVETTDLDQWRFFGTQIAGLAEDASAPEGALYLKADARHYRILVVKGTRDCLFASGWEVTTEQNFLELRKAIADSGTEIIESSAADRALRKVNGLFSFVDPSGNRHEVTWGAISDFLPFISPVGIKRFITGNMGMGHVVIPSMNFDASFSFWRDVCGFGLSDILHVPVDENTSFPIHFMHCNQRQHSLALAQMPQPSGCIHIMLEVPDISDVGRALDRIHDHNIPLAATLGHHVNDSMISFYVWTPGGFALEYGCGGLVVDWDNDQTVFETTRGSHWGHRWSAPPSST